MNNVLIKNIENLHTTDRGAERVRKNLNLGEIDVSAWCRSKILDKEAIITRQGKNWYIKTDCCTITVNAGSYTIITAHKEE